MDNDDLISRQAAINTLEELEELDYELYIRTGYCHLMEDHWDFVIKRYKEAIKETPCAQQKQGHWIEDAKTYYEELKKRSLGVDEYTPYFTDDIACSECLAKYSVLDNETQFFKYCPNCGARMEVEE